MQFDETASLLAAYRSGEMVVLLDDDDENVEGVLMAPAEAITADQINFMARFARGLICLTLVPERCAQLDLPLMVVDGVSSRTSHFTVSIEAAEGVSTGISAADRAHTVRVAMSGSATPRDLVQPGHVFPLRAESGGVLKRAGHTESGCDLARLAGFEPASVIADILNDDGTLARGEQLSAFAQERGLKIGTIADIIHYRLKHENTITRLKSGAVQTDVGEFTLHLFRDRDDKLLHLALTLGDLASEESSLVRVQTSSIMRDLLGSLVPGQAIGWNLRRSLEQIARDGSGALVIINRAETDAELIQGIDMALGNESMQETGSGAPAVSYSTVGVGSQILRQLGVRKMRLMGPPIRYNAISGFGLEVVEFVQLEQDSDRE